jgi:hypothetical protein
MSFKVTTRVEGGKETLKTLRKLDPEARKQFTKDAKRIAAPIVDEAKIAYPDKILSGMKYPWTDPRNGRALFPYSAAAARRAISVKVDTRARSKSLIKVVQKDVAASIIEKAGSKTPSNFERQLTLKLGRRPSRVMWPAAEKNLTKVSGEMEASLKEVEREIERLLR